MKAYSVMTRGIAALPERDIALVFLAMRGMAANLKPEPSMYSLAPSAPSRLTPSQVLKFNRDKQLVENGGRTLLIYTPTLSERVWIKKDDWREAALEDKVSFGVQPDTSYLITAMLPEEY